MALNRNAISPAAIASGPHGAPDSIKAEAARSLLQSSSHDLKHVASAVRFGSEDAMRRAFVRVLGKSPRTLRARKSISA